jgi:uncharacterized membrane-anchored protein
MKHLTKLLLPLAAALLAVPAHAQAPTAEQAARIAKIEALAKDLHPATGDIRIAEAEAVLHLGKDYYFLPAAEARRVLVDAWGNPPEVATDVLGLVFPAGKTFLDDTWGAVVTFDRSGWVSDEDAQSTDYNALLGQMQEGEDELNERRTSEGYPAQHLVGWAQQPVYDPKTHSVVWAQNIQFTGQAENSLNYDVRLLGRRGVLSLNMLTGMSKLGETRTPRLSSPALASSPAARATPTTSRAPMRRPNTALLAWLRRAWALPRPRSSACSPSSSASGRSS